jgi:MFS family permease
MRHCLRIRSLRLLALGIGIFNIFGYAAAIWMPAYFMRSHGMSIVEAGAWLGIGSAVGGIVGSFVSGPIVDALVRRHPHWQLRVPALGILLSFPVFILIMLLPGGASVAIAGYALPLAALLSVVTALLSSLWMGPGYSAVSRLVPAEMRTQAGALLIIVINLVGNAAGPVIAGAASDLFTIRFEAEALRYSLLVMSVLTAIGGILLWRASTHYTQDLADARAMG